MLRLLIRDWEKARDILEANHLAVKITDVVAIEVDHAAGSLTKVLEVLDRHQVNIEYLYAFAAGLHGKAAIIFRFADPDDAIAKIKSELKLVEPLDLFRELPE